MRIKTVKSLPVKPSLDCFYFLLKEGSKIEGELKVFSAGSWKNVEIDTNSSEDTEHDDEYVTTDNLETLLSSYIQNVDMNKYALKSDLNDYMMKSDMLNYVTKSDLKDFITVSDLNNLLKNYATKEDIQNCLENCVSTSMFGTTMTYIK
jgi:hypothetical protein